VSWLMLRLARSASDLLPRLIASHQDDRPRLGSNANIRISVVPDDGGRSSSCCRARRMNAICERLVGTLRREILDRERILRKPILGDLINEYVRAA